jgi:hypothetical protein
MTAASEPGEYCAVHDQQMSRCQEPERCRATMAGWGLYRTPEQQAAETRMVSTAGKADRILADTFDHAGNCASGLDLSAIGENGHAVANLLWKISGYLKGRASQGGKGTS